MTTPPPGLIYPRRSIPTSWTTLASSRPIAGPADSTWKPTPPYLVPKWSGAPYSNAMGLVNDCLDLLSINTPVLQMRFSPELPVPLQGEHQFVSVTLRGCSPLADSPNVVAASRVIGTPSRSGSHHPSLNTEPAACSAIGKPSSIAESDGLQPESTLNMSESGPLDTDSEDSAPDSDRKGSPLTSITPKKPKVPKICNARLVVSAVLPNDPSLLKFSLGRGSWNADRH